MLLAVLATMFAGCQKEESELRGPDGREPASGVRVVIDGEKALRTETTRAGGTKVYFEGGYATGAGLYDSVERPIVEAYPDEGYEVDYFYGGPQNEPKMYDYAKSDSSSFKVDLRKGDHLFHCGFKKKQQLTLTVQADPSEGGMISLDGMSFFRELSRKIYSGEKWFIQAVPSEGYKFVGWNVLEGDVVIDDFRSASTLITMKHANTKISARFVKKEYVTINLSFNLQFGAFVNVIDNTNHVSKQFDGAKGSFQVEKGANVTVRVNPGSIKDGSQLYPTAQVDDITVLGNNGRGSIIASSHGWTVNFAADSNSKVLIHCKFGKPIN